MQLRPYQRDAIERTRALIRSGARLLLVVAPTGAGKTVIATDIMLSALARGKRVLFFAHRRELIDQTYRKLIAAGAPPETIGIMMSTDKRRNDGAPIQIASIDTFRHREPPPADLVIIDEAHRSLSQSYLNVIKHYSDAVVIGLTATPYRADGGGLGSIYQALDVVATPMQLIEEGFLAEPRIFAAAEKPNLKGVRVRAGDYVESELAEACLSGKLVGNIIEHWQKYAEGRRTVAFAINIAHSQAITAAFREAGIAAEHLDGNTPTSERAAILARLESGETLVVSNCGVLCEGWDQPAVKCAILARPTMSTGLYLQQAGRILRPWEGVTPILLDHAGNCLAHGLPQDTREFSLDCARPKKTDRKEAQARECECGAVLARGAQKCTECGAEFQAEIAPEVDNGGVLVEIDARWEARKIQRWKEIVDYWRAKNQALREIGAQPYKRGWVVRTFMDEWGCKPPKGCKLPQEIATDEEKAAALEQLHETAMRCGYKPGWAMYRFKERFGHFPMRSTGAA